MSRVRSGLVLSVEVRGREADDRSKELVIRFETKDHITSWMSHLERISQLINVRNPPPPPTPPIRPSLPPTLSSYCRLILFVLIILSPHFLRELS